MALKLLGLFVASLVLIVGSGCAYKQHLTHTLASQEKEMIEALLAECKGRVSGPSGGAEKFDISPPRRNQRPERSNLAELNANADDLSGTRLRLIFKNRVILTSSRSGDLNLAGVI